MFVNYETVLIVILVMVLAISLLRSVNEKEEIKILRKIIEKLEAK
jgi:hypothetical protein